MLNITFSLMWDQFRLSVHLLYFTCAVNSQSVGLTRTKPFLVEDVGTVQMLFLNSQTGIFGKQFITNYKEKRKEKDKRNTMTIK